MLLAKFNERVSENRIEHWLLSKTTKNVKHFIYSYYSLRPLLMVPTDEIHLRTET